MAGDVAPIPGAEIWEKSLQAAAMVPGLKGVLTVSILPHLPSPLRQAVGPVDAADVRSMRLETTVLNLRSETARESGDALT